MSDQTQNTEWTDEAMIADYQGADAQASATNDNAEQDVVSWGDDLDMESGEQSSEQGQAKSSEDKTKLESKSKVGEEKSSKPAEVEKVKVWLKDGTKSEIEVNYSDKAAIKDAFLKAHGMRKAFSERDELKRKLTQLEKQYNPEMQESAQSFLLTQKAFERGGIQGALDVLFDAKDVQEFKQSILAEEAKLSQMLPHERALYEKDADTKRLSTEKAELEASRAKLQSEMEERKQEILYREQRSVLTPSFQKYAISSDTADKEVVSAINKVIWEQAVDAIGSLPEGSEVTPEVADRIFANVSSKYSKSFEAKVQQKVQKQIQKKKEDAQQAVVTNALRGANSGQGELQKALHKGSGYDILKQGLLAHLTKR